MEKKDKIPPKEYNEILSGLDLHEIYLSKSSSKIDDKIKESPQDLRIELEDECSFSVSEKDKVRITQKYHLLAVNSDDDKTYVDIKATYVVTMESKLPFTESFFEVYKITSLPLNTWPFLREFINNMTARMNIPPLTLPLFRNRNQVSSKPTK